MTHYLKFAIIQGIIAAICAAHFISGIVQPFLKTEIFWLLGGLSTVLMYGLYKVFMRDWSSVAWTSQILVRCGVAGLQGSMAVALLTMATSEDSGKAFLGVIGIGIIASFFAIVASILLSVNAQFLGESDEALQE